MTCIFALYVEDASQHIGDIGFIQVNFEMKVKESPFHIDEGIKVCIIEIECNCDQKDFGSGN